MPKRFVATETAAEKGFAQMTPEAGAKLVSEWIKELGDLDAPGAKQLLGELQQLEKELSKNKPDVAHVKKIMAKIGPETTKLSEKCEDKAVAQKVHSLGQALTHAAS